jgi:hypothetical protein
MESGMRKGRTLLAMTCGEGGGEGGESDLLSQAKFGVGEGQLVDTDWG